MPDHQFISTTYNYTKIMKETDKAIVTYNLKIAKISVTVTVTLANLNPDLNGLRTGDQI